jgi:hypothetical protein
VLDMLGRKDYTREELENSRTAISAQLAAYRRLASAAGTANGALDDFQTLFFNNMVIVLDRYFVHRVRLVTGKDANPLNEVELLADSLMRNGGQLLASSVIKWQPEQTVLGLVPGQRIAVTEEQFERLSAAFLDELERRFVPA